MRRYNWKKDILPARELISGVIFSVESARASWTGENNNQILGITRVHLQKSRLLIDRLSWGPEDGEEE